MSTTKERTTERLLEASGRITPRMVLEAYEKTGLAPRRRGFYAPAKDAGCPLYAVGTAMQSAEERPDWSAAVDILKERTPEGYVQGFMRGIDELPERIRPGGGERAGYRDGARTRRVLLRRHCW